MKPPSRQPTIAQLRDLIEVPQLAHLDPLYLASPNQSVQQPVYVTDIQQITSAGPDSFIVLSDEAANNSWKVSVALRYAWERRAAALAVPADRVRPSMIDLARRLEISLLGSGAQMLQLSLTVAFHLGVAQAGRLTRLQQFTARLASASSTSAAVDDLSAELEHSQVSIRLGGIPIARSATMSPEHNRRTVDLETSFVVARTGTCTLTAQVPAALETYGGEVLEASIPTIRGLLTETTLTSLQDSLPMAAIASLSSLTDTSALDPPSSPTVWGEYALHFEEPFRVVCLLADDTAALAPAIHYLWDPQLSMIPLTQFDDGWLSAIPASNTGGQLDLEILDLLQSVQQQVPLRIGLSTAHTGAQSLHTAIEEAWAAARLAPGTPNQPVVAFDNIRAAMVDRFVPAELAHNLLGLILPDLMAHENATELIRTALSFFTHSGSIARAAQELGIHRNTFTQRLEKLNELGCPVNDPATQFPYQLMFTGHIRYLRAGGPSS